MNDNSPNLQTPHSAEQHTLSWRPPRGMPDVLPPLSLRTQKLYQQLSSWAQLFGCQPIYTPLLEHHHIIDRSLGHTSDIVTKENFSFPDKSGHMLTLRPEGTAPIMRAFLQAGLHKTPQQQRFSYYAPMYRHERPQYARYRQFYQFGMEFLHSNNADDDVELISSACMIFESLKVSHALTLRINSLGTNEELQNYSRQLKKALLPYQQQLSPDSQQRLLLNPLRILDSKDSRDQRCLEYVPEITSFLSQESQQRLQDVIAKLRSLYPSLSIVLDPKLVRGLDYYSHTAFEFVHTDADGKNITVLAGGRYDSLSQTLGGPPVNAIGYALGCERLLLLLQQIHPQIEANSILSSIQKVVYVVPMDEHGKQQLLPLMTKLRNLGICCLSTPHSKGKALRFAARQQARFAILVGQQEILAQNVILRDLENSQQYTISTLSSRELVKALTQLGYKLEQPSLSEYSSPSPETDLNTNNLTYEI